MERGGAKEEQWAAGGAWRCKDGRDLTPPGTSWPVNTVNWQTKDIHLLRQWPVVSVAHSNPHTLNKPERSSGSHRVHFNDSTVKIKARMKKVHCTTDFLLVHQPKSSVRILEMQSGLSGINNRCQPATPLASSRGHWSGFFLLLLALFIYYY